MKKVIFVGLLTQLALLIFLPSYQYSEKKKKQVTKPKVQKNKEAEQKKMEESFRQAIKATNKAVKSILNEEHQETRKQLKNTQQLLLVYKLMRHIDQSGQIFTRRNNNTGYAVYNNAELLRDNGYDFIFGAQSEYFQENGKRKKRKEIRKYIVTFKLAKVTKSPFFFFKRRHPSQCRGHWRGKVVYFTLP